ncbi:peptidase M16 [Marinomonas rhizomae]|nr:insulinase family protein [Marinomonas rhizomae]RNF74723.1 peptidase M16 [Marinomonas rhizomae]
MIKGSTTPQATQENNQTETLQTGKQSLETSYNKIINIPNKSLTDKNDYHLITLNNNLKVLLVSDPQAERFAASLSVNVGNFQDPDNQQGLAHFLEHMLFLGTEKYPEAGNYQSYINTHGGSHNAYTSTDTTNFHFDIKPSAYEGALDRFSQFFTSPLFSESLTQREKNAVDSEYKAKLKDEGRRNNQALKTLLNPEHPYSHFTVGSLETLKNRPNAPLRKQLLKLYKENYFSENMALVMVANLPYNQMATLARQYFSDIPSKTPIPKKHYPTLTIKNKPQLQFVRSLIDNSTLNFYYPIDAQGKNYKTQPTRYLSYILGNENKGSLYASLKSEGLINGISASTSTDYGDNALFSVRIALTDEGLKKVDTVAKRFFATLSTLKSSPINPLYLQEGLKLSQLMFNNQSYVNPQSLARSLSARILKTPTEDILSCYRLESAANKSQVRHLLKQLSQDNLLVQLTSNHEFPESWAKQTPIWKIEPWYQSSYSNNYFSQLFLDIINLSVKSTQVSLPEKNNFIPESLDLINKKDPSPTIIFQKEGFTYWNKSDSSFGKPTAMNFLAIRFADAANTPKHTLLNKLWSRLFNDSISELTYAPYIAGLGYAFYPHANGATLRTSGYSDKQSAYVTWLIDQLFLFRPTPERFKQAKAQLAKDLSNQKSRQAYRNASSALSTLITKNSFTTKQLEGALEKLSLEDLQQYTKRARERFDIVGYSTGNLTKEQAEKLANAIYERFSNRLTPRKPLEIETKNLTSQQNYHYQFESTSDDKVVLYALIDTSAQLTPKAIKEKAYFSILRKLLNSPFYQELRTNQQLGYIVGAQNLSIRNTPILGLLVQSPNTDTLSIIRAIEDFLKEQSKRLPNISEKDFSQAKSALLSELKMAAKNLSDNALNEWHQIAKPDPDFLTREEWINNVEEIQRTDFIAFINRKLQSTDTTKIIIHNKAFPKELTEQQDWKKTSPNSPSL